LFYAWNRSDIIFYVRQYQRLMGHWRKMLHQKGWSRWTMRRSSPIRSGTLEGSLRLAALSGTRLTCP
jgi:hypothetical protein